MGKVVIDINSIVPYLVSGRNSGISRTTLELVQALDKLRPNLPFKISLLSQNLKGIGGKNINTGFSHHHIWLRNTQKGVKFISNFRLRELLTDYDLLHIPHNFDYVAKPEKTILTIHDAMFFSYPEEFGISNYTKLLPLLAKKVKGIITISESSKNDIIKYMDIPEEKITVIPWGVDHSILYPHEVKNNKYCDSRPYFISVSCDIGRKNTISLVKAFTIFSRNNPEHHLILVWRQPSEEVIDVITKNKLEHKVHFASNISNEELAELYAGSTASFFPSLYEGFGLPIVESMACGVPCVTCRNSSLEEVGGDAAIYVEPLDCESMADIMEDFENGNIDMNGIRKKCIQQASGFTWDSCARKTIEVYRNALNI